MLQIQHLFVILLLVFGENLINKERYESDDDFHSVFLTLNAVLIVFQSLDYILREKYRLAHFLFTYRKI